jgi:hypothetical protein
MIALVPGVRVYLACGTTDMRKGMAGLAMLVQQGLSENPFDGALYAFRGRRAGLIKLLWHDGVGPGSYGHPRRMVSSPSQLRSSATGSITHVDALLMRLTDSEVEAIDGVVSQVSDRIEDGSGILEEVSSSRLSIDEKVLLPDLHVDPVHGDIYDIM